MNRRAMDVVFAVAFTAVGALDAFGAMSEARMGDQPFFIFMCLLAAGCAVIAGNYVVHFNHGYFPLRGGDP